MVIIVGDLTIKLSTLLVCVSFLNVGSLTTDQFVRLSLFFSCCCFFFIHFLIPGLVGLDFGLQESLILFSSSTFDLGSYSYSLSRKNTFPSPPRMRWSIPERLFIVGHDPPWMHSFEHMFFFSCKYFFLSPSLSLSLSTYSSNGAILFLSFPGRIFFSQQIISLLSLSLSLDCEKKT